MPAGKPAGLRCVQLDEENRCLLFGHPSRPRVCSTLRPEPEMCGESREEAFLILGRLEEFTQPSTSALAALAANTPVQ